jgi:hypothetical protein
MLSNCLLRDQRSRLCSAGSTDIIKNSCDRTSRQSRIRTHQCLLSLPQFYIDTPYYCNAAPSSAAREQSGR